MGSPAHYSRYSISVEIHPLHCRRDMLRVSLVHNSPTHTTGAGHDRDAPSVPVVTMRAPSTLKATLFTPSACAGSGWPTERLVGVAPTRQKRSATPRAARQG